MDKMNLESQTLISVDESKLQGLIILKVTDVSTLQTVRMHVQSTEWHTLFYWEQMVKL